MSTLKLGMIGLDTSHCSAFTKILNKEDGDYHIPGATVAGAYPGGSNLFSKSRDRVQQITDTMAQEYHVTLYDSIENLGRDMDAFLLESVDGRQHLEQFKKLAPFGKPVFIDKPFACSYQDAKEITQVAKEHSVPLMTASAIRFGKGISELCSAAASVESCDTFGPLAILEDYPGYFWYGIHEAETLYSYMKPGCVQVRAFYNDKFDIIIGEWEENRLGSVRGLRIDSAGFGCTVFTDEAIHSGLVEKTPPFYALLLEKVISFFQTGQSPVPIEESLEVIGFLEAAYQSRMNGGSPVKLPT